MTSGLSYSSIKIAHQVREFEEKRSQERKRNLLCLIHHFLQDEGYHLTAETFEKETRQVVQQTTVCDNIDLSTILQEYESYYFLRFQKYPKICKKSANFSSPSAVCAVEKRVGCRASRKNIAESADESLTLSTTVAKPKCNNNQQQSRVANLARAKSNASSLSLDVTVTPLLATPPALENEDDGDSAAGHAHSGRLLKPFGPCYDSLGTDWKEYVDIISKEIFVQKTDVRWDDVKGLESAKTLLKEAVIYPAKYPQLFKNILKPWKGLLLFGPPGTGKTLLAKAVATESNSTFFNISASSIISKWRGESEKLVRALFEVARHQAPSTIFFDELDAVASRCGDGAMEHEASRRLKSELLTQLDGLTQSSDSVCLLATSNVPWDLDPAMLRRLEKRILVDLPSVEARKLMIQHYLPERIIEKPSPELRCQLDYDNLAKAMEGYSGSDIRLVCKETAMSAMRKALTALEATDKCNGELDCLDLELVTDESVLAALQRTRPSAPCGLSGRHRAWHDEFGTA